MSVRSYGIVFATVPFLCDLTEVFVEPHRAADMLPQEFAVSGMYVYCAFICDWR